MINAVCMINAKEPGSAAGELGGQPGGDAGERNTLLRHRVALADRHGVVLEGLEVDRDAERRADLVLAAVAPPDRLGVVELDVPVAAQLGGEVARLRRQGLVARE